MLNSFPDNYRALIIGSTGGIGSAFVQWLTADPRCAAVVQLSRQSIPALDLHSPDSITACMKSLDEHDLFHLIIVATGVLHTPTFGPEKKLADISYEKLSTIFTINTFAPAFMLPHLTQRLDPQRGLIAVLSAKVGSITDNRLGGWYSYRASKAALNMVIKTAAIELKRIAPSCVLVALHPGTVNSSLSKPFGGEATGTPAAEATRDMLDVLNSLKPEDSGTFVTYSGERLPW